MALLAIGLALTDALCFAVAAALQHHEAAGAASRQVCGWRLLSHLLRRPWWLAGVAATLVGAGLHVIALSIGPLALVQPVGVCAVVFALPVAAALHGRRPARGEVIAAVLVVLGLSGFLLIVPSHADPVTSLGQALALASAAASTAAVLTGFALSRRGRVRALLMAISAGVLYGTTCTLVHAGLAGTGQLGFLGSVARAALALPLAVAGLLLTQHAYRTGGIAIVLATTTVTDPVTAVTAGAVTLREGLPSDIPSLILIGCAAGLVICGIAWLARSPVHQGAGHDGHRFGTADQVSTAGGGAEPDPGARLRILIGSDTFPPDVNGASYFTQRLAVGLAARGHEVFVACPAHPDRPRVATEDGVVVHRIPSIPTWVHPTFRICPPPAVGSHIGELVNALRPDVVHAQGHFLIGRALIRHARHAGIPVVATNHFMPENLLAYAHIPGWARRVVSALAWRDFARVFGKADYLTSPTPTATLLARSHGVTRDVQAISCGIDLTRFHPRQSNEWPAALARIPRRASLLFVGRLDEEKHVCELIDALPRVREITDAQLLIVGVGSQQAELRQRSHHRGVAEHVHFLGFVPDADLPSIYAAADVFCMPGVAELQSIATLEAMASGLPVVAANAVALPHLVRPGINGYLYPPGDTATLAEHLAHLLGAPSLRQSMGQASRIFAADHDIHTSLARFETLYTTAPLPAPTTTAA